MKRIFIVFVFHTLILLAQNSYAQWEPIWSVGAGIGAAVGVNESIHQSLDPEFIFSLLWLNGIAPHWSIEANIGFGKISSPNQGGYSEYSTYIAPYDIRVRYAPFAGADWQPYIYAGIGVLSYNVSSKSPQASVEAKLNSSTAFLPVGIGIYHPLDKNWAVEASIGENPSFTDDLNPVHDNRNDAFWGFKIEISYAFGEGHKEQQANTDEFDFGSRGTSQIFGSIAFDSAKAHLRPESDPLLVPVLNSLVNHPDIEIQIRVYTDNSGDFNTAMALTQERAESIKVWLVSRGISASRISIQGYGPHNPLVQNDSPENRLRNHRVEIVRMK
jgi:outer membrane protein OmpA-like peptidoglycan-associated protein